MLDHLSLNVKVLFGLIKMEFMVSGTAWFSVLSIYLLYIFSDSGNQSRNSTFGIHLLDYQEKLHVTVWVELNTAVHRELLPEVRPHQCVPFQTVLCWTDPVLSGNGASLPTVIIKPESWQLHKQNFIYNECFCNAIRDGLFFWHVLERHIFTVISLGNHRNKSTICLDSFSFEFRGLNWLTCFLCGVCLH